MQAFASQIPGSIRMTINTTPLASPLPSRPRRRISRPKRLFFSVLCLFSLIGFIELTCYIGLKTLTNQTIATVRADRQGDASFEPHGVDHSIEVAHPYVGWTRNPDLHQPEIFEGREFKINDFGLADDESPIRKRSPEKIIVAVAGGSVAWQMSVSGNDVFLKELQRQPRFQGKKIELVRLALSGFKQPQQLMLLTFLLSLGAEFDVLVNLDGYNETALHPSENAVGGIFPPYPRAWKARLTDMIRTEHIQTKAQLFTSHARRKARSRWYCRLPFQNSATVNFMWLSLQNRSLKDEMHLHEKMLETRMESPGYQILGPHQSFRDDDEMFDYLVSYWAQCSRQLDRICKGNAIDYHHVLPPNQYLMGSKPQMNAEEYAVAMLKSRYGPAATKAYPRLVKQGHKLREEGLKFHDLTQLFATVAEPIYADECCHYNPSGNELLAAAVAKLLGSTTPQPQTKN
jgi:hypothetical protein